MKNNLKASGFPMYCLQEDNSGYYHVCVWNEDGPKVHYLGFRTKKQAEVLLTKVACGDKPADFNSKYWLDSKQFIQYMKSGKVVTKQ